ncbi:multiple sugar transport system ATP-binding protein/lactose/L-arabinose transport system ATP-binding protein [Rhizobium sp. RU35A]|uniref:ABC transporter ATP-binding protein n=1 Tax=Rhizobium sp. RU35A TaxID=1907414 RepID=UPI00095507CD|nr:sn-glycerol-3-phosphate ABC transporter ATP-binding protein UgpC [Rhizobium sp. RU35A]SIQ31706.1 multiple sugar transport system ATP-binding protein/lactose/L-arabinose transport system ATP-binding protein [Rhizobium sp. RU35A]
MTFLQLDNIKKTFGELSVIKGVDISASRGEFVVFVGPSGCGKSTLLRMIAGLEDVSSGTLSIDGKDVTYEEPAKREVSMVFQSYALYPHMSVFENMAFGLRMAKLPEDEIRRRVAEAARILQIEALLERKPRALSGGQRQRVAIGRSIVRNPKIFLFDEPLSNLDAELRSQMRVEIAKLHRNLGATMVYVTHDQVEAMTLADRIVVLRAGLVEQIGTPTELYDRPANTFVAGFIGSPKMNFLTASVTATDGSSLTLRHSAFIDGAMTLAHAAATKVKAGDAVTVGLRPEHLDVASARPLLRLTLDFAENLGGSTQLYARTDTDTVTILANGRPELRPGEAMVAGIDPRHIYLFTPAGAAL